MKTVAAFANGEGGTIVFGIDPDELTLLGLSEAIEREARDQLGNIIHGMVTPTPDFEVRSACRSPSVRFDLVVAESPQKGKLFDVSIG
jgi:predicted HTH transcriptional regulator